MSKWQELYGPCEDESEIHLSFAHKEMVALFNALEEKFNAYLLVDKPEPRFPWELEE